MGRECRQPQARQPHSLKPKPRQKWPGRRGVTLAYTNDSWATCLGHPPPSQGRLSGPQAPPWAERKPCDTDPYIPGRSSQCGP